MIITDGKCFILRCNKCGKHFYGAFKEELKSVLGRAFIKSWIINNKNEHICYICAKKDK